MATPGLDQHQHSRATARRRGDTGTDLIHRLIAGDPQALLQLYDGTARKVFGLVQAIVSDPADAEKVTFDVYLDIWRNAAGLDRVGAEPELCVLAMAHRLAVEHRRSRRAAVRAEGAVAQHETAIPALSGVDGLGTVPAQLLSLTYYGAYTCRQAATLLGLPVAAAQVQLRTALRALARPAGGAERG